MDGDFTWSSDGRPSVGWALFALSWITLCLPWLALYAHPTATAIDYIPVMLSGPICCAICLSGIAIHGTRILIADGRITTITWLGRCNTLCAADTGSVKVESGYYIKPLGFKLASATSTTHLQLTVDDKRFVVYSATRKGLSVQARTDYVTGILRRNGLPVT